MLYLEEVSSSNNEEASFRSIDSSVMDIYLEDQSTKLQKPP